TRRGTLCRSDRDARAGAPDRSEQSAPLDRARRDQGGGRRSCPGSRDGAQGFDARRWRSRDRVPRSPASLADQDPRRRVIARLRLTADPAIDVRVDEARRELAVQEQMIDAKPSVPLPMVTEVV